MARNLTEAERETLGAQAWELSLRKYSQQAISREIGVSRPTVKSLLDEQRKLARKERGETIGEFVASLDAAIREIWRRLDAIPPESASPAAAGLIKGLDSIYRTKAETLGYYAPRKSEAKVEHSHNRRDQEILRKMTDEELNELIALQERVGELCKKTEGRPDPWDTDSASQKD